MPIKKETSSRLVRFGYNFESVPRQIVEQLTNPDALAYYVYLLTRPDNWVVRRNHLREHFNSLSLARHNAAMRMLREIGLVWTQNEKGVDGKFTESKIMCGAIPIDDLPSPQVQIAVHRENPQSGKTDESVNRPLKDIQITKDIQIKDKDIHTCAFEAFYSLYPKKTGKAEALKAWMKLKPSPELTKTLITDCKNRVDRGAWCLGKGKAYIPGPAPYLNKRKWEDEIIPRPEFKQEVNFSQIAQEADVI